MRSFLQPFLVAVLTALVFGAGFSAGRWYEFRRPLPPPPGAFMGEFGGHRDLTGRQPPVHLTRAEFSAEVEKLRPQIEAFRKSMDGIGDQFEHDLDPILTPEQRAIHAERIKRRTEFRKSGSRDEQSIMRMMQWSNWSLFRVVTLQLGLDDLNRELKFDDAQRDKVIALLRARRERFLALIDNTPPPSLGLLHLAPFAQRLSPPPGPSAGSPPDSPSSP